ncbi:hypothetical protein UT300012_31580 [Paraclostridium bifermentans]
MGLSLNRLIEVMEFAERNNLYFGISVTVPGCDKPEVIINHPRNLNSKLEYYKNAYDNICRLKVKNEIRIVKYAYGKKFNEIQRELGL